MSESMERDVAEFVSDIAHELGALSGRADAAHVADAAIEASNLVAAIIAADGRLTDSELDAYLDSIGPLLDPPLITTADHVRGTDLSAIATSGWPVQVCCSTCWSGRIARTVPDAATAITRWRCTWPT